VIVIVQPGTVAVEVVPRGLVGGLEGEEVVALAIAAPGGGAVGMTLPAPVEDGEDGEAPGCGMVVAKGGRGMLFGGWKPAGTGGGGPAGRAGSSIPVGSAVVLPSCSMLASVCVAIEAVDLPAPSEKQLPKAALPRMGLAGGLLAMGPLTGTGGGGPLRRDPSAVDPAATDPGPKARSSSLESGEDKVGSELVSESSGSAPDLALALTLGRDLERAVAFAAPFRLASFGPMVASYGHFLEP